MTPRTEDKVKTCAKRGDNAPEIQSCLRSCFEERGDTDRPAPSLASIRRSLRENFKYVTGSKVFLVKTPWHARCVRCGVQLGLLRLCRERAVPCFSHAHSGCRWRVQFAKKFLELGETFAEDPVHSAHSLHTTTSSWSGAIATTLLGNQIVPLDRVGRCKSRNSTTNSRHTGVVLS